MKNYSMEAFGVEEKRVEIGGIPCIYFSPRQSFEKTRTIIFYHGWSSSKERQRMRASILSSFGFKVLLPDALYHGERKALKNYNLLASQKYIFWDIVGRNREESSILIDGLVRDYGADPLGIFVMGHSMGGITSGGVLVKNRRVAGALILNGSCDYKMSNEIFKTSIFKNREPSMVLDDKILSYSPKENVESILDRPMLILHGEADSLVDIRPQAKFFKMMREDYGKKDIDFIAYENLNHYVTVDMMEESISWLGRLD